MICSFFTNVGSRHAILLTIGSNYSGQWNTNIYLKREEKLNLLVQLFQFKEYGE